MGLPSLRRSFVHTSAGVVHIAECGPPDAPAVLLLHQTPRSWREFQYVLPLLGGRYRAIAMDTLGFGDSDPPAGPSSIEVWAAAAADLLAALGLQCAHIVGHHTGGVIAVELAAAHPSLVDHLVLSSTPYTGAEFRRVRAEREPIDLVEPSPDGTHLAALWQRRQGFYPLDRPDLLQAFVRDALVVMELVEDGHTAVGAYEMERTIGRVEAPTLIIRATDDPFAYPHGEELRSQLTAARSVAMVDIAGGMVPLPDQLPQQFADALMAFLPAHDSATPRGSQ